MMSADELELALKIAGAAASGLAALWGICKYLVRKWKSVRGFFNETYLSILRNTELAERHTTLINDIMKELKSNGGTSLRDAVNRVEARLANLESKTRMSMVDADIGVFETDSDGLFTYVNRTYCRLAGLVDDSTCLGKGWLIGVPEDERDRVRLEWRNTVDEEREFDMIHKMGENVVHVKAYPIFNKNHLIQGWFGLVVPVKLEHSIGCKQ